MSASTLRSTAQVDVARFLNNAEAAAFLRLSPRTLEKRRMLGDGPRFRKIGRRVIYALDDLISWANARSFEATFDPDYGKPHPAP